MDKKLLHIITFSLLLVGGLNWGLVGLLDMNLVESLLGYGTMATKLVYILVGASAVFIMLTHQKDCKICGKGK